MSPCNTGDETTLNDRSLTNWEFWGESCFTTHRQLVDAQGGDGRPVAPQLRDEGELVEVPDDAGSIPRAADHDAVRRWRRQARHAVRVSQQRLEEHSKQQQH